MLYPKRDYMAVMSVNETTATHIKTEHYHAKVNELAALEFTYVTGMKAKASVRVSVFL